MGNKAISNRLEKIMALNEEIDALQAEVDALKDEIKQDMTNKALDELSIGKFTIRYKDVSSTKFDSKKLKSTLPDVYALYSYITTSKRFTIS